MNGNDCQCPYHVHNKKDINKDFILRYVELRLPIKVEHFKTNYELRGVLLNLARAAETVPGCDQIKTFVNEIVNAKGYLNGDTIFLTELNEINGGDGGSPAKS